MKRLAVLGIILAMVLMTGGTAYAGSRVDEAGNALKKTHVFQAGDANPSMSQGDIQSLEDQISKSGKPVYIAVMADGAAGEVNGNYDNLPKEVAKVKGGDGAVAVVAGTHIRAGSSSNIGLQSGQAGTLATSALSENSPKDKGSIVPMLHSWVDKVVQAMNVGPAKSGTPSSSAVPASSGFPWGVFILVIVLLAIIGGVLWTIFALRRTRQREEEHFAKLQASARKSKPKTKNEVEVDDPSAQVPNYSSDYPVPTRTVTNINVQSLPNGAYNYGYYPGMGGWGYYGAGGMFSPYSLDNIIMMDMMEDRMEDRMERRYEHEHYQDHVDHDSAPASNGGDWESSSPSNGGDYEPASNGGDWGGSSSPAPEPYHAPEPSYSPPAYDPPSYDSGSSSGGWDSGGGGGGFDSGGGGGGGDW